MPECDRTPALRRGAATLLTFMTVVAIAATACGNDGAAASPTAQPSPSATQSPVATAKPSDIKVAVSSKPRAAAAGVPSGDVAVLVDGNTDFAFDVYQQLRKEEGNLFYSPFSISLALAMTYAGARGETERQMADTLSFALPQDRLHPAFNALDRHLAGLGKNVPAGQGTGFQLSIANSIWGQHDFKFIEQYLDTMAVNYGAGMRLVDYMRAAEEARLLINGWVEDETKDRIKDLIPPGVITPDTRLVLANAIYFKASWLHQFSKQATAPGQFTRLDGSKVNVPMMHQGVRTRYAEVDGVQAVELPYVGNGVSMLLLLPAEGKFREFEASLDAARVKTVVDTLGDYQVTLTLPKFEFESTIGLKEVLKVLGMTAAFDATADFSGMDGKRDLYIQDALHKAFVKVDEEGTEAAAATAIIVGVTSMPQPATMTLDRPFVFLVRDRSSGTVLFAGRVLDPGA